MTDKQRMKNLCENQTFRPTITMASHSSKHRWLCLSASLWRSEDMERDGVSIFPPSSIPYCLSAEQCEQCEQCGQCEHIVGSSVYLQSDDTFLAMRRMAGRAIPHTSGQSLNWSRYLVSTFPSGHQHHRTLPQTGTCGASNCPLDLTSYCIGHI